MNLIDRKIEGYKRAYHDIHGEYPTVTRKGSWIYINDNPTAHRSSKIDEFTKNLKDRKNSKLEENNHKKEPEYDEDLFLREIRKAGRLIFRSRDIRQMQNAGKKIAKMAKRILNEIYPLYLDRDINYIDFCKGLRTRSDLKKIVYENIMDLSGRRMVDWLDIVEIWNKHQRKERDLSEALIVLSSLEIHLKAMELN